MSKILVMETVHEDKKYRAKWPVADPGFPRRGAPTYYLDGEWARIPSAHLDPPLMAHMSVISISFRPFPEKMRSTSLHS